MPVSLYVNKVRFFEFRAFSRPLVSFSQGVILVLFFSSCIPTFQSIFHMEHLQMSKAKNFGAAVFALLSLVAIPNDMYAIRQKAARAVSAGVGVVAALAAGIGGGSGGSTVPEFSSEYEDCDYSRPPHCQRRFSPPPPPPPSQRILRVLLAGGSAGGASYFSLYWFTPKGRMRRAKGQVRNIQANHANQIIEKSFDNDEQLLAAIKDIYAEYEFYLYQACSDLRGCLKRAQKAVGLLEAACCDTDDEEFVCEANEIMDSARQMIARITKAIALIRDLPQYEKHLRNRIIASFWPA